MMWALAALLLLQPVLDQAADVRLVAMGNTEPVTWIVDGAVAGSTAQRQPLTLPLEAGPHAIVAQTGSHAPWQVVARLDQPGPGIVYAPAWTASSPGDGPKVIPAVSAFVVMLGVLATAWAQSKRP